MQWGTPEDLDEYKHWSNTFKKILNFKFLGIKKIKNNLIIKKYGLERDFKESGFKLPKPLIDISGESMMIQAVKFLRNIGNNNYFYLKKDKFKFDKTRISKKFKKY